MNSRYCKYTAQRQPKTIQKHKQNINMHLHNTTQKTVKHATSTNIDRNPHDTHGTILLHFYHFCVNIHDTCTKT